MSADVINFDEFVAETQESQGNLKTTLEFLTEELQHNRDRLEAFEKMAESALKREDNPIWQSNYQKRHDKRVREIGRLQHKTGYLLGEIEGLDDMETENWSLDEDGKPYKTETQLVDDLNNYRTMQAHSELVRELNTQIELLTKQEAEDEAKYRRELHEEQLKAKQVQENLQAKLKGLKEMHNLSATQIADLSGVDPKKLRRFFQDEQRLTASDLEKLASSGSEWAAATQDVLADDDDDDSKSEEHWSKPLDELLLSMDLGEATPYWYNKADETGNCPSCGHDKSKVERSTNGTAKGLASKDVVLERQRKCLECNVRWNTFEIRADVVNRVYMTERQHITTVNNVASLQHDMLHANDGQAQAYFPKFLDPDISESSNFRQLTADEYWTYRSKKLRPLYRDSNLAVMCPPIANEWHPTLNASMAPDVLLPKSPRNSYWLCSKCEKHYQMKVNVRTQRFISVSKKYRLDIDPETDETAEVMRYEPPEDYEPSDDCPHCLRKDSDVNDRIKLMLDKLAKTPKKPIVDLTKSGEKKPPQKAKTEASSADSSKKIEEQLVALQNLKEKVNMPEEIFSKQYNALLAKIGFDA